MGAGKDFTSLRPSPLEPAEQSQDVQAGGRARSSE